MIRTRQILFAGLMMAAAAFAIAAQDTLNLRVSPKKDDAFKYKFTGTLSLMGMDVKATYTQTTTVLDVVDGVITTESGDTKGSLDVGGQEMEMPDMGATKTKTNLDGTIKEIIGEAAGPDTYRNASLLTIFRPEAPIKVGDEWTWTAKADGEKGTRAMSGKYKAEALEDVAGKKTLKVTMEVKETEGDLPASAKGTVWLDLANGMTVKSEADVKNAPIPGAPEPVSGKLKSELVP